MKTKRAHRLTVALILPLLFALGCDTVDQPATEPEAAFRITCFAPEDAPGMLFVATGALVDEGAVEGEPLPWNPEPEEPAEWSGLRTLQGRKDNLVLHVEARLAVLGSRIAEGEFTIVEGTGAYAGLQGHGKFEVAASASGHLEEYFEGVLYGN